MRVVYIQLVQKSMIFELSCILISGLVSYREGSRVPAILLDGSSYKIKSPQVDVKQKFQIFNKKCDDVSTADIVRLLSGQSIM